MTSHLRLLSVTLQTVEGAVEYEFSADVTVLAGPTGVGKTSLLELIKFGFGNDGKLAPVATESVTAVALDVEVGDARLRLRRPLDPAKSDRVGVWDLATRERLPDHFVSLDKAPSLNGLLMDSLGLPTDLPAASRGKRSGKAGARISFGDVYRHVYVPQSEINKSIAGSSEPYYTPKRKAVFELLLGLTNPEILLAQSRANTLKATIEEATATYEAVMEFLRNTKTTDSITARQMMMEAEQMLVGSERTLAILKAEFARAEDRETQTLRSLLTEAEQELLELRRQRADLERQRHNVSNETRRIDRQIQQLNRMLVADSQLANIEFVMCPRCMQSIKNRGVAPGQCRLCLQDDPVAAPVEGPTYEIEQLEEQLTEVRRQTDALSHDEQRIDEAIAHRHDLVAKLSSDIDHRLSQRVSPHLQAYQDAAEDVASARATLTRLDEVMRQWDRADDLERSRDDLQRERDGLLSTVSVLEKALKLRREEIIAEVTEEFNDTALAIGIPGVEHAEIDASSYLPLLDGKPFDDVSFGGGIITATQVCYWMSLLTVALRRRDTDWPALLIIDSPRLALNTAHDLTLELYRRLVARVGAAPGRVQVIIADNELAPQYQRDFDEIVFDYGRPTVSTIPHPGRAQVETIDER